MKKLLLIFFLLVSPVYGQEVISDFKDQSLPVLNEELNRIDSSILKPDGTIIVKSGKSITAGLIPVSKGGTGLTTVTDDSVLIGNGSIYQAKILPSCSASTSALRYTTSGNTFSCGTVTAPAMQVVQAGSVSADTSTTPISITQAISSGETYVLVIEGAVATQVFQPAFRFNSDSTGTNYGYLSKQILTSSGPTIAEDTDVQANSSANQVDITDNGGGSEIRVGSNFIIKAYIRARNSKSQIAGDLDFSGSDGTVQMLHSTFNGEYDTAVPASIQFTNISANSASLTATWYLYKLQSS